MTQEDRRVYLIKALRTQIPQYGDLRIPADETQQKQLIRALMNVRPPIPATPEFLAVQDAYLKEEIEKKGVVDCRSLIPSEAGSRIALWRGDITCLKADAIVNAANSALLGCFHPLHSCIDNVIHSFSGVQLRLKCSEIMQSQGYEEPVGTAKITPGYNLPCKYILHTVGPVISGPLLETDCEQLAGCYRSCLELSVRHGVQTMAFCCISTGVFHFPQEKAAEVAVDTVSRFLAHDSLLTQVIFDVYTERDLLIYQSLLN